MAICFLAVARRLRQSGLSRIFPLFTIGLVIIGVLSFPWYPRDPNYYPVWIAASSAVMAMVALTLWEWFYMATERLDGRDKRRLVELAASIWIILMWLVFRPGSTPMEWFLEARQDFYLAAVILAAIVTTHQLWYEWPPRLALEVREHSARVLAFIGILAVASTTGTDGLFWRLFQQVPRTGSAYDFLDGLSVLAKCVCLASWYDMSCKYRIIPEARRDPSLIALSRAAGARS